MLLLGLECHALKWPIVTCADVPRQVLVVLAVAVLGALAGLCLRGNATRERHLLWEECEAAILRKAAYHESHDADGRQAGAKYDPRAAAESARDEKRGRRQNVAESIWEFSPSALLGAYKQSRARAKSILPGPGVPKPGPDAKQMWQHASTKMGILAALRRVSTHTASGNRQVCRISETALRIYQ
jgi:hypothetical protein